MARHRPQSPGRRLTCGDNRPVSLVTAWLMYTLAPILAPGRSTVATAAGTSSSPGTSPALDSNSRAARASAVLTPATTKCGAEQHGHDTNGQCRLDGLPGSEDRAAYRASASGMPGLSAVMQA
jgi:hypothetical protein